jgi:hypothetical protein
MAETASRGHASSPEIHAVYCIQNAFDRNRDTGAFHDDCKKKRAIARRGALSLIRVGRGVAATCDPVATA